jgi:hypothetical protein
MRATVLAGMLAFGLLSQRVAGQTGSIVGVAYDSLRATPLRGALVTIANASQTATTDSGGLFRIDGVSAGQHTLTLFHDVVDSLGLSGLTARVSVGGAIDTVRLAVPGFATLWRRVCGPTTPPRDSGFLFGSLRSAERRAPVGGAKVRVQWAALEVEGKKTVAERQWGGEVQSDPAGAFAVCGIPADVAVRINAAKDSSATSWITIEPRSTRVRRQDLVIALGGATGTVAGVVRDASGAPASNARVAVDTMAETRTDSAGRFIVRRVRAGTREMAVIAIGAEPTVSVVDVYAGDTTLVAIDLHRVTTLAPTVVSASTVRRRMLGDLEYRRSLGIGHFMDSVALPRHASLSLAISMLTNVRDACYFIDGIDSERRDALARHPMDIAVLETHRQNDPSLAPQYRQCRSENSPRQKIPPIIILLWTKNWLP